MLQRSRERSSGRPDDREASALAASTDAPSRRSGPGGRAAGERGEQQRETQRRIARRLRLPARPPEGLLHSRRMSSDAPNESSSGLTACVSLDGAIANWVKGLRAHVAARRGVADRQLALNVSWDLAEWGVDDPAATIRDFLLSPMSGRLKLIAGAEEGVASLRDAGFRVVAVTRRDQLVGEDPDDKARTRRIARQWFEDHPGVAMSGDDIWFTGDPVSVDGDLWIDDSPRRVRRLVEAGKTVWLLPQPWNRSVVQLEQVSVLFDGWASAGELIAAHRHGRGQG